MNIPENAGLGELRQLLAQAENKLSEESPKLVQYRINENNAKSDYGFELAIAKVEFQDEKTETMRKAKAAIKPSVRGKELEWNATWNNLVLGESKVKLLEGQRDTLKCMIKSEQTSY